MLVRKGLLMSQTEFNNVCLYLSQLLPASSVIGALTGWVGSQTVILDGGRHSAKENCIINYSSSHEAVDIYGQLIDASIGKVDVKP